MRLFPTRPAARAHHRPVAPSTRRTRRIAATTALAVTAGVFAWAPAGTVAGAATTNFTCGGVEGDQAGTVNGAAKSSKELLALLATLGGSAELTLPVDVAVTAPASVATGSGAYDLSVQYKISLPDSLVNSAKNLLKVTTFKVTDASFAVDLSGAATGSVVGTTAQIDVGLATTPVVVTQTIAGKVTPTTSGLVYYRPGATKLSIVVGASVPGVATIGTITVTCSATGLLGSTAVRPPGSPIISPNPIVTSVGASATTSVDLGDGAKVTPDQGNPIVWDSLKLVGNATAGTATLSGKTITFAAPAANGSYDVTFEVCGASRTIPGAPGVNEVQRFAFSDAAYSRDFPNVHPLDFTLTFDGQETAPIVTSFVDIELFGNTTTIPYAPGDDLSRTVNILSGRFGAPSPATVQKALEALPNVAPGDVVVTGGPTQGTDLTAPYVFTFGGALSARDVPQISLGRWDTWLPNEGLDAVLAAASSVNLGGGTPPPTVEQSFTQLVNQQITAEQFWQQFWARVQYDIVQGIDIQAILDFVTGLFPKKPVTSTTTAGEPTIPESSTGLLCSQGVAQFVVSGGTAVQSATTSRTATTTPTRAAGARAVRSADVSFTG